MPRRKNPQSSTRPEPVDELPNGFRLFQLAEGGAYLVQVKRELLANEISERLLDECEGPVSFQEIRPLHRDSVLKTPVFLVSANCSLEEMQHAIRLALYDVIQFDGALVQLNLCEFPT